MKRKQESREDILTGVIEKTLRRRR